MKTLKIPIQVIVVVWYYEVLVMWIRMVIVLLTVKDCNLRELEIHHLAVQGNYLVIYSLKNKKKL